jgi:hypothetical protein
VEAEMDVSREIMKEPLKASLVGLDKCIETIKVKMDANKRELMAEMDAWLGETMASPERQRTVWRSHRKSPRERRSRKRSEQPPRTDLGPASGCRVPWAVEDADQT